MPDNALPGTINGALRLHRGPLTQMLEGLEAMLQEPHGCFEQTSSSTYPNVMILRYLKANGVNKPEIEARAQRFIALGYQRLLSFEVGGKSGSFSLYGQAPTSSWLTAYGLLEFSDMAAVYPVDPALLERMRAYLKTKMRADGSFDVDGYRGHEGAPLGLASTAYVVMALGEGAPEASVQFLRNHVNELERDSYLCALAANALLKADRATAAQLSGKLRALAQVDAQQKTALLPAHNTLAWGYGDAATVEASALGVLALLQTGQDTDLVRQLLAGIQQRNNAGGAWGSTHATVLALKALERASAVGRKSGPARAVVEVNGQALPPIELPAEETAVPAVVKLDLPRGKSRVRVRVDGGPLAVRVSGEAFVPWGGSAGFQPARNEGGQDARAPSLEAKAGYDALEVEKDRPVLGTLAVTARGRRAEVPMVEWGLPAGFTPEPEDLAALKAKGSITRWEVSGRRLRLYLPDLPANQTTTLTLRFLAGTKGTLTARAGRVYEYYRAEEGLALAPARFEIK